MHCAVHCAVRGVRRAGCGCHLCCRSTTSNSKCIISIHLYDHLIILTSSESYYLAMLLKLELSAAKEWQCYNLNEVLG